MNPPKKASPFFPFLFLSCSNHHSFRLRLSPLHRATGPHRPYPIHRSQRSRSWRRRCPTAETPLLEIYLEGFPKQPFSPNTPPPHRQDAGLFRHFFRYDDLFFSCLASGIRNLKLYIWPSWLRGGGSDPTNSYKNPKERSRK